MMYTILNDFIIEKKVPFELINEYKRRLPKQIIQIWEEYGFGSFMKGFLRIIKKTLKGSTKF